MAMILGHTSLVPGPSNEYQCPESESPVPGPSNQGLTDKQRTPVSFFAIAMTPTIAPTSKPGQRKKKHHATIITATPIKKSFRRERK